MMKKLLSFLLLTTFSSTGLYAQLVDKTPAPIPNVPSVYNAEPWENPLVDGINRDAARATAYSYSNIKDALAGDREKSGRMLSLNVTGILATPPNLPMRQKIFLKAG